jgi:aspartyl-tRNA(Asn)/glutamyl-tRNA(Gln) amidotransferase subunit B
LALDSNVEPRSAFDRKHYFYSDLPTGYQITQHYCKMNFSCRHLIHSELMYILAPIASGGALHLSRGDVVVRIKQIQLEQVLHSLNASCKHNLLWRRQDTAKSVFDPRQHISQIDLNRAGTGLVEIVSESDMRLVIPCLIIRRY